jgi:hypothetical protein
LNTSINRYKTAAAPVTVPGMSHPDLRAEAPDNDIQAVAMIRDDDPPARRLLAHDMEHLVWDDDADTRVPPPD